LARQLISEKQLDQLNVRRLHLLRSIIEPDEQCYKTIGGIMAVELKERYVVDDTGNRVAVLIDIKEYRKILEALEELESISSYDEARSSNDEIIPFDQAIKEIESQRR
jgi:PHD/YefM family antitoxin component YafN of YafNO toxin-antitoxin module